MGNSNLKLLIFLISGSISIFLFTFGSYMLYLGLTQEKINLQLLGIGLFSMFIMLGILPLIVIIKYPPDFSSFDNIRKKVEFVKFGKKTLNWFLFVVILYLIIQFFLLLGIIFFPTNSDYFELYRIIVIFFGIAMIISYCPVFDLLKEGIYNAKLVHLLIVMVIASICLLFLYLFV